MAAATSSGSPPRPHGDASAPCARPARARRRWRGCPSAPARAHRVHPDAFGRHLTGEADGERVDGALRRRVVDPLAGPTEHRRHRRHVHDRTALARRGPSTCGAPPRGRTGSHRGRSPPAPAGRARRRVDSRRACGSSMPALLTRPVSGPSSASAAAKRRSTSGSLATSACTRQRPRPRAPGTRRPPPRRHRLALGSRSRRRQPRSASRQRRRRTDAAARAGDDDDAHHPTTVARPPAHVAPREGPRRNVEVAVPG